MDFDHRCPNYAKYEVDRQFSVVQSLSVVFKQNVNMTSLSFMVSSIRRKNTLKKEKDLPPLIILFLMIQIMKIK